MRRYDPLQIFGFAVCHLAIFCILSTLLLPRWIDPLVPAERRSEGDRAYAPQVILGVNDVRVATRVEAGLNSPSLGGEKIYKRRSCEFG